MTSPPLPASHRRRWLVVLLLVAAAGIALQSRSPGDPRLIGRWKTAPQTSPIPHIATFDFRDDGVLVEGTGFAGTVNSYWFVDGDTIVTQPNRTLIASTSLGQLRQWLASTWTGAPPPRPPDAFRIVVVTRDKLVLEYVGVRRWPQPTYSLTRVP